jgi:hypothetical protein
VLDAKATSPELLYTMRRSSRVAEKRHGRKSSVTHFTLEEGRETAAFNVFKQDWWASLTSTQKAGVICSALGLIYGTGYGRGYYTDANYTFVHFVIRRHRNITSWIELRDKMHEAIRSAKQLSDKTKAAGDHVLYCVERLADLPALNHQGETIDFANAFARPCHYYFDLCGIRNTLVSREVGKLISASLVNTGAATKTRHVPVVFVIDEFQELVSEGLADLLVQCRSLGIAVILSNQVSSQLITPDCDLRATVQGNTSMQMWMAVTDEIGREELRNLGNQKEETRFSTSYRDGQITGVSRRDQVVERINGNAVSAMSADVGQFFLRLTENSGYSTYGDAIFMARSMFHQTKKTYEADCKRDWPTGTPGTLINREGHVDVPTPSPTTVETTKPRRRKANRLGDNEKPNAKKGKKDA